MNHIEEKLESPMCTILKQPVQILFRIVTIEENQIGPKHMSGCNRKHECIVSEKLPNGGYVYNWEECPIYKAFP